MKQISIFLAILFSSIGISYSQSSNFNQLDFILGDWSGSGKGFGNAKSKIESSFKLVMNDQYIEVRNESWFEPTESKPEGEHHIDKGFISYDKSRKTLVFRQFNIEGYVNQYILDKTISNDSTLIFKTETIENFPEGGKTRWTIKKISEDQIETIFDVAFPNEDYACFGINTFVRKENSMDK